jgi:formylglycine-generating enzyme required for sulfatase activity
MNQFDHKLQEARARQHRFYIFFIVALVVAGFSLVSLFAYTSGTAIKVLPADAEKTAQVRVTGGLSIAISNVVYGLSDTSRIAVSAQGFQEEVRDLTDKEKGGNIVVELREIPGHLVIRTSPPFDGTRWKMNGQRIAIAAGFEQKMASGTYSLEIDSPFYEIEKRSVQIARAERKEITIPFRRVEGELKVNSTPPGSPVSLDDNNVGKTPLTLKVGGGKHQIKILNKGFQTIDDTLEITNSEKKVTRNYRLLRQVATLDFKLSPAGGTLLLNGKKINAVTSHNVRINVDNSIRYSLDGFYPKSRVVKLSAVKAKTIVIKLASEIGKVNISSSPSAEIFINKRPSGSTPTTLNLIAKKQSIQLRKAGYRTITKNIVPSSKRPIIIRETLQTEAAARLSEAPQKYTNSVGISLQLFRPTKFTMGAPRHQRGQRANEFIRNIELKKPFYASQYEITNAQYQKFKKSHSIKAGTELPATSMSWAEAAAFSSWLSKKEGLVPFYHLENGRLRKVNKSANGYRLLSEAEWEWLARRASRQSLTVFPWGNDSVVPNKAGNIADETARGLVPFYIPNYSDGFPEKAAVGSFPAEKSGLFDLTGNVSEWVHDFYSLQPPRANTVEVNPLGPRFGDVHVIKGSSSRSGTRTTLRAAYRDGLAGRRDDVGFRIGRYL